MPPQLVDADSSDDDSDVEDEQTVVTDEVLAIYIVMCVT